MKSTSTLYVLLGDSIDRNLVMSRCSSAANRTSSRQYDAKHCTQCWVCDRHASVDGNTWANVMLFGVGSNGCLAEAKARAYDQVNEAPTDIRFRIERWLGLLLTMYADRHQAVIVQVHSGLWDMFGFGLDGCNQISAFGALLHSGEYVANLRQRLIAPVRHMLSKRRPDARLIWRSMPLMCAKKFFAPRKSHFGRTFGKKQADDP